MYENQNDRQFENSGRGKNYEDSRMREGNSSESQTQPDRTEEFDFNNPTTDNEQTGVIVEEHSGGNQINQEEYELSRLHAVPNNNDFSSMNEEVEREDELDEEEDVDLEKEDDDNDVTNPSVYGGDLTRSRLRDSQDPRGDDYRNEER